VLTWIDVLT